MISSGVLVEHRVWGRGKVVESTGEHLVVYFPLLVTSSEGPRRKFQAGSPHIAISDTQTDSTFEHIECGPPMRRTAKTGRASKSKAKKHVVHNLESALEWFKRKYPGLFNDPRLIREELAYKREAHAAWVKTFGGGRGRDLIARGNFAEISAGLDKIHHATNIPSRFEIMAAHDGYRDGAAAGRVLRATLDMLDAPGASSFEAVVDAIASLPAPADGSRVLTWPNVTILLFLADPKQFMVVKPQITQRIAARMAAEIVYSPRPTWHCYEAVGEMSGRLLRQLEVYGARDFIDVQSFMWVTANLD